jgi:PTS system nitrogen regulatory IIA component
MNALAEILAADDVELDVATADSSALLEEAASLLARRHALASRLIADALVARERLGSTALGHGIALPHARIAGLPTPFAAFLRTKTPIPFDAPDARPVFQFLTLIVPAQAADRHLQLLACAATMFGDRHFRDALRAANTPLAVAEVFAAVPTEETRSGRST